MRPNLLAVIIVALTAGCSIDYSSRVGKANRAVISFLISYTKYQSDVFSRTGAYKDPFPFAERSGDVDMLAQEYADVKKNGYSCRFDVAEARFAAVCTTAPNSRLQIGFYVDESRAIRLGRGVPNRSSPKLSLNPAEEHKLYGDAPSRL